MKTTGHTAAALGGMAVGLMVGGVAGILCGCSHSRLSRCVCRKARACRDLWHSARDILFS